MIKSVRVFYVTWRLVLLSGHTLCHLEQTHRCSVCNSKCPRHRFSSFQLPTCWKSVGSPPPPSHMFLSTGTTLLALDSAVSFVLVSSTCKRSYKIFTKPLCPSRLFSLPVLSKPTLETRLARVRVLPSSMTCTITQCCKCSQQMPKCMDARRL